MYQQKFSFKKPINTCINCLLSSFSFKNIQRSEERYNGHFWDLHDCHTQRRIIRWKGWHRKCNKHTMLIKRHFCQTVWSYGSKITMNLIKFLMFEFRMFFIFVKYEEIYCQFLSYSEHQKHNHSLRSGNYSLHDANSRATVQIIIRLVSRQGSACSKSGRTTSQLCKAKYTSSDRDRIQNMHSKTS